MYINDNTDKQYLFSINAYNSMVELFDVDNNDNKYYIWRFNKFFDLNLDYSPCSYEIFSLKKEKSYIIAFLPKEKISSDKSNAIFIKKFRFKSFDKNAFEEIKSITFESFENKKILTSFLIDGDSDDDTFVVLTCTENSRRRNSIFIPPGDWLSLRRTETSYVFKLVFYSKELEVLKDIELRVGYLATYYKGEELFIKSLYINRRVVAFIYYRAGYDLLYIDLYELNYRLLSRYIVYKSNRSIKTPNAQRFNFDESLNDFVKVNNKRLAFIYTSSAYTCILIININDNNNIISLTDYYINFDAYTEIKQISGFSYNDHLMLSATAMKNNECISILIIFGYTEGIDKELDNDKINSIIFGEQYFNLFDIFPENFEIENNIFGYNSLRAIRFISIPEALSITIKNLKTQRTYPLRVNNILCSYDSGTPQVNTQYCYYYFGILNEMKIEFDSSLIEPNQYYYIEYQYISIEKILNCPDNAYGSTSSYSSYSSSSYYGSICSNYEIRIYYGRTNRLKIKTPSTPISPTKETSTIDATSDPYHQCDNPDNENEDNYEKIKNCDFISQYNGVSPVVIKNSNGYALQITTYKNELNTLKGNIQSNFSVIDLKDCADLLREQNGLNSDDDLIIIKYENDNKVSNGNEKSVQYEVYLPNSNTKLDLSVCSETDITLYVPIELSEKTQSLYDSLKDQGYNLFDKNDDFYLKFCTIYNSLNGTDVILPDRHNIYQRHKLECQNNCEYSDYLSESKYLKCKCGVNNEEKIETKTPEKITGKEIEKSFVNVLKYSNYKVLYCYNLVFRKVTIKENLGSILSMAYFTGYLIGLGILLCTKASYLKKEIDKLIGDRNVKKKLDINNNGIVIFKKNSIQIGQKVEKGKNIKEKIDKKKNEKETKEKKDKGKKDKESKEKKDKEKKDKESKEKINKEKKVVKKEKTKKKIKNSVNKLNNHIKKGDNGQGNGKKSRGSRNQSTIQLKDTTVRTIKDSISDNKKFASKDVLTNNFVMNNEKSKEIKIKKSNERKSIKSKKESKKIEIKDIQEEEIEALSNFELNELVYEDALELDNRNFLKIYWYLLKREQIVLFTFINWNDFNLFSIKLSKLFLALCSDMAFNVFFFSDESMHKTYETGGKHDWLGHLAQIAIAMVVSQILQVFVNFLTMTDIHYYELKGLKRDNKINGKKALSVIRCIKIKIIAYIISTFLMFLFFWYASSAFCAVYPNTQRIFIVDSYTGFLMGLLYPFVLYLFPTALRVLSLKAKKSKNLKILYSLSDKIPFF